MPAVPLRSAAELLSVAAGDPFVRGTLRRGLTAAWRSEGAIAWTGTDAEEQVAYLHLIGEPAAAAVLLAEVRPGLAAPQRRVTVPRGTAEHLDGWSGVDWDFRWTAEPPADPSPPAVPVTDAAVAQLLALASPGASAQPGDPHVRAWWGVPGPDGLVACAADTSGAPGVGHISSVAVHPEHRGRGLGGAVTATLTRELLRDGCDVVTLGHYPDNAPAAALYERLGFRLGHRFTSGALS